MATTSAHSDSTTDNNGWENARIIQWPQAPDDPQVQIEINRDTTVSYPKYSVRIGFLKKDRHGETRVSPWFPYHSNMPNLFADLIAEAMDLAEEFMNAEILAFNEKQAQSSAERLERERQKQADLAVQRQKRSERSEKDRQRTAETKGGGGKKKG